MRLTWRVAGARWVSIDNGLGEVDETGACEVFPAASGSYALTATARGGDTLTETVSVRVVPVPLLRTLCVPAPELSHTVVLRGLHVAAPALTLAAPTIRMAAPSIRVPLTVDLSVRPAGERALSVPAAPSVPSPRPLGGSGSGWARTDWLPRIGDVFDRLYERVKSELHTRFGEKP